MPRISFSDVQTGGGFGFQGGRVRITNGYSTVFQYPPNAKTQKQSAAFTALVLKAVTLNSEGLEIIDHETGEPQEVDRGNGIVIRMGDIKSAANPENYIHPGQVAEKDIDNTQIAATDLGNEVGVEGNSFFASGTAIFNRSWGFIEGSLDKLGFKREILGRAIATDFIGMDCTFKLVKGDPYPSKKPENLGTMITPENLVVERVHTFPYDIPAEGAAPATPKAKPAGVKPGAKPVAAKPVAGKPVAATAAKANGAAAAVDDDAVIADAIIVLNKLSPTFKAAVAEGEPIELDKFRAQFRVEMMRQRPLFVPTRQAPINAALKDLAQLEALSEKTGMFAVDGESGTVVFAYPEA